MEAAARSIIETTRQDWEKRMESLTLSKEEIIEATGYRRAAEQLEALNKAGIPADRRPDGSVRVWRHHIMGVGSQPAQKQQRRRGPELASDRKAA